MECRYLDGMIFSDLMRPDGVFSLAMLDNICQGSVAVFVIAERFINQSWPSYPSLHIIYLPAD